jgi:hypothetical protein
LYIRDDRNKKITLDDYFLKQNIFPSIIKADIEGYETDMLKGSPILFTKHIRGAILCSYHNPTDYMTLSKILKQFGFQINSSEGYMFNIYAGENFNGKDMSEIIRKGLVYGLKNQ